MSNNATPIISARVSGFDARDNAESNMKYLITRIKLYFSLLKSLQTALLTITGIAGFMSARCPVTHWSTMVGMV